MTTGLRLRADFAGVREAGFGPGAEADPVTGLGGDFAMGSGRRFGAGETGGLTTGWRADWERGAAPAGGDLGAGAVEGAEGMGALMVVDFGFALVVGGIGGVGLAETGGCRWPGAVPGSG